MHAGSNRRDCVIDGLAYRTLPTTTGLRSRARSRAAHNRSVEVWLNRAISIIRQLWSGKLSDALLATDAGEWANGPPETVKPSDLGESLVPGLRACVRRSLDARPPNFPSGAAALKRQQGVGLMAPGPSQKGGSKDSSTKSQKSVTPNRGDIWPASVENIALPPPGTDSIPLREVSPTAARFLDRFESEMLRSPEERLEVARHAKKLPYVDPVLQRDMLKLAARMAAAGMLRPVRHRRSTVGMFTAVKKISEKDEFWPDGSLQWAAGTIVLRLVLDQRIPNLDWREPPWVALGGREPFRAWI